MHHFVSLKGEGPLMEKYQLGYCLKNVSRS